MSDLPSAPRGRHWRGRSDVPTRYETGRADTSSGYLPRITEPTREDPPKDIVDSVPGLYRVPVPGDPPPESGPGESQTRLNRPPRMAVPSRERSTDLVVPRVYLEPDEAMDRLRQRALRWAIVRDVLVSTALLYVLGRLVFWPLWQSLAG